MLLADAVNQVLIQLEQTDEEEYDSNQAEFHILQGVRELSEDSEFKFDRKLTGYTLTTPQSGFEPDYWQDVPGRELITTVLGTTWDQFGYVKKAWLSVDGSQTEFPECDLRELLDKYGDSEGQPEGFAIDGDYIYWRPIAPYGTDYASRFSWVALPPATSSSGATPRLLDAAPFAVIYKACAIASIFLNEDQRVLMFEQLAERAFDRFNLRHSITGDSRRDTEMYDG